MFSTFSIIGQKGHFRKVPLFQVYYSPGKVMKAIFYDLETSDRNFVGQILNYCFLVVDDNLKVVGELSGLIRLSRLQLPSPGAILANRTDVLKHQQLAQDSELAAMRKIASFLSTVVNSEQTKIPLIGYNSTRFDLPYLRTSFIRNGINPYFGGRLVYRDLYMAAKKLLVTHPDFPRSARADAEGEDAEKVSISLETLTTKLGLLQGKQSHESRDDVLLTVALARRFKEQFQLDVRRFDAYEVAASHRPDGLGLVRYVKKPAWELKSQSPAEKVPMALHDFDQRSALWIDLNEYKAGKGRESMRWFGVNSSQFTDGGCCDVKELCQLAQKAREELAQVRVSNFFATSTCDIEQDIYRVPMAEIDCLGRAIASGGNGNAPKLKSREAQILFARYKLANFDGSSKVSGPEKQAFENLLQKYGEHRYGGKLQLVKNLDDGRIREDEEKFAQSFDELMKELSEKLSGAKGEDRELLESLRAYYIKSEIVSLCFSKQIVPILPQQNRDIEVRA